MQIARFEKSELCREFDVTLPDPVSLTIAAVAAAVQVGERHSTDRQKETDKGSDTDVKIWTERDRTMKGVQKM